jgi:hypothetical protein
MLCNAHKENIALKEKEMKESIHSLEKTIEEWSVLCTHNLPHADTFSSFSSLFMCMCMWISVCVYVVNHIGWLERRKRKYSEMELLVQSMTNRLDDERELHAKELENVEDRIQKDVRMFEESMKTR